LGDIGDDRVAREFSRLGSGHVVWDVPEAARSGGGYRPPPRYLPETSLAPEVFAVSGLLVVDPALAELGASAIPWRRQAMRTAGLPGEVGRSMYFPRGQTGCGCGRPGSGSGRTMRP
jgi:hypothetical protein